MTYYIIKTFHPPKILSIFLGKMELTIIKDLHVKSNKGFTCQIQSKHIILFPGENGLPNRFLHIESNPNIQSYSQEKMDSLRNRFTCQIQSKTYNPNRFLHIESNPTIQSYSQEKMDSLPNRFTETGFHECYLGLKFTI